MTDSEPLQVVVLGVDAQGENRPAALWAADEAARRGLTLRAVHAVQPAMRSRRTLGEALHREQVQDGRSALDLVAELVHQRHPQLKLSAEIVEGLPAPVLLHASHQAALVVLGSRELSRLQELLSGYSVTVPVTAQAGCPVVVVRQLPDGETDTPHLVVGVDGSPASVAALEAALESGQRQGAAVHAVWAWQRPHRLRVDEDAAIEELRGALAEAVSGPAARCPDVALTQEVLSGHPVQALAHASRRALAVVVGRRGSGGFTGMRLGSVPHGLLRAASCPVVTVPGSSPAG